MAKSRYYSKKQRPIHHRKEYSFSLNTGGVNNCIIIPLAYNDASVDYSGADPDNVLENVQVMPNSRISSAHFDCVITKRFSDTESISKIIHETTGVIELLYKQIAMSFEKIDNQYYGSGDAPSIPLYKVPHTGVTGQAQVNRLAVSPSPTTGDGTTSSPYVNTFGSQNWDMDDNDFNKWLETKNFQSIGAGLTNVYLANAAPIIMDGMIPIPSIVKRSNDYTFWGLMLAVKDISENVTHYADETACVDVTLEIQFDEYLYKD